MAKASPALTSFNGGIVSSLFDGRTDVENYSNSCAELENLVPTIQGPVVKRPGTLFVNEVKDSSKKVRLIDFEFSIEQAYVIELGDQYMRFYTDNEQLVSGTPVEIATPFLEAELFDIQFAQTADLMYLTHPNHHPQKLSRTSTTTFVLEDVPFFWPPFQDENFEEDDTVTVTGGIEAGDSVTITAANAIFDAAHVGSAFRIGGSSSAIYASWLATTAYLTGDYVIYNGNVYVAASDGTSGVRPPVHELGTETDGVVDWTYHNDGEGYIDIEGFTSSTVVTGTVVVNLPTAVTDTFRWSKASWSDFQGYPRTVAFYENRLVYAGTAKQAQTIWGSISDAYEEFKAGTNDDDSFAYTINTNQVNTIQWLAPARVLSIGTAGGEFIARGGNLNDAITPTNIRITRQTTYGGAHIRPVQVGADVFFVQRSLRKLREYRYNFEIEGYQATDLNIFSDDVLAAGVVSATYQQEPTRVIWLTMADGNPVALTFERQQGVVGWNRHSIGGTDVEVESTTVIPHPDGDVDQVWMVVKRTIDGSTVRYVERMEKLFNGESVLSDAVFSDSAVIYDGAPTTTITGLDHLEGETVVMLCDGAVLKPDQVVVGGEITLPSSCSKAVVGLPYEARIQTLRIDAGSENGTPQGKTGRIHNLTIRVRNTGSGLFYGTNFETMSEAHLRITTDLMDNPVPLKTGDIGPLAMPNGYEKPLKIALTHGSPLPFTLVALYPQLHKQDR